MGPGDSRLRGNDGMGPGDSRLRGNDEQGRGIPAYAGMTNRAAGHDVMGPGTVSWEAGDVSTPHPRHVRRHTPGMSDAIPLACPTPHPRHSRRLVTSFPRRRESGRALREACARSVPRGLGGTDRAYVRVPMESLAMCATATASLAMCGRAGWWSLRR